jgi:uncharacterized protein
MSEATNVDIVKRGYEAFGRGDVNGVLSLLEETVEWETPGSPEFPTAGRRRGHREVAGFFHTLAQTYDFERFEPKSFIAQGDSVVVLGEDSVRLKSNGTRLEVDWVHVFELRNGKVVRFREYFDTAPVVAAMATDEAVAR